MKKIAALSIPILFLLVACSASDVKMVKEEIANGLKETKYVKQGRKSRPTSKNIPVVNSTLPECKGITLHEAKIYHEPFRYGGRVLATIPMYHVVISNSGKRKKVIFDIDYTLHGGSKKYGSYYTRSGTKEDKPITVRTNSQRSVFSIGKADGKEVYTKIAVVDCY